MAKAKSLYVCSDCGAQSSQWAGQCNQCGSWNSFQEEVATSLVGRESSKGLRFATFAGKQRIVTLSEISAEDTRRFSSTINELDRVLGGGIVNGSVVLIGGDPGIGKSTLLLQSLANVSQIMPALYVSGEESAQQIASRSERLGLDASKLKLMAENRVEAIIDAASKVKPAVMVIDSIQTLFTDVLQSAPGSVSQVRETAALLVRYAKQTGISVILVGHVTKDGSLAGPRVLEHMVDTVLYFEGDSGSRFRLVRAIKNRFGPVNEIGVFAMQDDGLHEVSNPSAMFLGRKETLSPGSVVLASQEGTRSLLVEVQALVDDSQLSNPRRLCVGLDGSRLAMILAVLHRHAGLQIGGQDVFVNVVGGVRVFEPASDLAVALAIFSSFRDHTLTKDMAVFGELGLTGEVRPVQRGDQRIREAIKLGFTSVMVPEGNMPRKKEKGIRLIPVKHAREIQDIF
ncbi:MAG: DNA repair protein RadA [Gammaproteobacteria bacterium]|nr:MAG: DNA repair protein RadA [Gammaproteobacteria bacterium]